MDPSIIEGIKLNEEITVRAYSSSANLGPGFDVLGVALDAFYDDITILLEPGNGNVAIKRIEGPYAREAGNGSTAVAAVKQLLEKLKVNNVDVYIEIYKGIPPGRGLGSSGASAAGAVKAASIAFGDIGSLETLIEAAGYGEIEAAGSPHYDNVAASLLGGLVIVAQSKNGIRATSIPLDAWFTVIVPMNPVPPGKTGIMRSVLPKTVTLTKAALNWSRLAMLVAAAFNGDLKTLGEMMSQDDIVEPARSRFIKCYSELKSTLLGKGGALGFAISGAGPAMIALAQDRGHAGELADLSLDSCKWDIDPIIKTAHTAMSAHEI